VRARLTAEEAPELFGTIEALRRALRAPRVHRVLVTDEFNAAMLRVPRLGMLAGYSNQLLLGLPLAKALTAEQFKAVLAHELAHLAQANELEADAASARLVSPGALAQALTAVSVVGSWLEQRYWPRIHGQRGRAPLPAFAPYSAMGRLASELQPESIHQWLKQALSRKAALHGAHPSLAERLAALGQKPKLLLPAPGEAADRLFGAALERITRAFDERWKDRLLSGRRASPA
jgi:Zn-dependent protease with chaperone function